jgi:hypothetical protein
MSQKTPFSYQQNYSKTTKLIVLPLWGVLSVITIFKVTIPVANAVMVCLVHGPHAYFHDGLRITDTRPARFTNGQFVPGTLEVIIGFGSIVVTILAIAFLLAGVVEVFRRAFSNKRST